MQDRPICFKCREKIEYDPVFEAPCGADHDECASAVFHGVCLMEWRELLARHMDHIREMRERWIEEHERNRDANQN